ncbi:MAG: ABC transporter ATP-binding protein [SAR202 cluster bacterium]|nr:ABC transporter ATP-binding protein [SAR202 cluster bacterium]
MNSPVIEVKSLWKTYGSTEAVKGIDLRVGSGEVFALLGPNGAGKSTTVEILEGHRTRDSGEVSVLGHDPARAEQRLRERIGIVLQRSGVEPYLTVEESVEMFRNYYPSPSPLDEVLEVTGLTELRRTRVRNLSGGQQRRLDVAIGLAGNPDLLFLDEPTTGFDPAARRNAWDMIRNLKALGKTVFLTTHYLDEAEQLSDRVAIIVRGEIARAGTTSEMTALGGTHISFRLARGGESLPPPFAGTLQPDGRYQLRSSAVTDDLHGLTTWARHMNCELIDLRVARRSLEDIYLELVGRESGAEA